MERTDGGCWMLDCRMQNFEKKKKYVFGKAWLLLRNTIRGDCAELYLANNLGLGASALRQELKMTSSLCT